MDMPDADSAVPQSPCLWECSICPGAPSGWSRDRQHSSSRRDVPQDLVHALGLSMSCGPRGDQSVQHPADSAIVHSGSPYPSVCRGIWGIEAALRSLPQRATPAAVMLASASSQEERHGLGRLPSPLGGASLHPDWRPWDMNCGAGPRRQVTERREERNVQSVKDS